VVVRFNSKILYCIRPVRRELV